MSDSTHLILTTNKLFRSMDSNSRPTARTAAVGVVAAFLVPITFLLFRRVLSTKKKPNMPACLPLGWIATTKILTNSQGIWSLASWATELGYVFRLHVPQPQYVFCVGDPVLARAILQDPTTTKPRAFYGTLDEATGASNIFTANGERWRHARKAITPAFSTSHIKRMNRVCQDKLEDWIQHRLNVCCQTGEPFDAAEEMIFMTLSIISEAAFEYDMKQEEAERFVEELDLAIREFLLRRGSNPFRSTWLGYLLDAEVISRAYLASRNIQAIAQNILDTYRAKQATEPALEPKGTVIEYIVKNTHYENDKERIADMLVLLVGGHDTTAYTVAWTLLELSRHPAAVEYVRKELSFLSSEEERLKCPALDHLIKEGLRLHPVAANYLREVNHDFRVDDGTVIPKGSVVFILNLILHRHPQYFDQPDEFRPERWNSTDHKSKEMAFAFAPFSSGARNCVGQALANAELHTVLARLVMDYNFELVDAGTAECTLTLKPSGLKLRASINKTT